MKRSALMVLFTLISLLCLSCVSPQKQKMPGDIPTCRTQPGHLSFASQQLTESPVKNSPATSQPTPSPSSPKDYGSWWIKEFGALSEADHPLVSRVQNIFARVLDAADKRGTRFPKLIIPREAAEPWAICLKDGTVLLTQKAMEICYQGVDKKTGDARVAFVLGHELAHLARDDFWHAAAFEAVARHGSGQKAIQEIVELLNITDTTHAGKTIKQKELQADAYGLLYSMMAGYDPRVIVNTGGKSFFREWTSQITGKIAYSDNENMTSFADKLHPTADQRAAFLLSYMKTITNDLDIFNFGVRLYQLGRYEESRDFLEAFKEKFPCREVFNNIGLTCYQLAVKELAECDPKEAYRFKLSTIVDTYTLAASLDTNLGIRRQERGQCKKSRFKEAIRYFRSAREKDRFYVPARVNLSSALIMTGRYSEAMAVLDEASDIRADDPKVLNNRAVAMYMLGPSVKTEMFHQASEVLKDVIKKHQEFSDAYYNLARLQEERGRHAARQKTWKEFLQTESAGVYAEIAGKITKRKKETGGIQKNYPRPFSEFAPVKLGELNKNMKKQLAGFTKHSRNLGEYYADYYSAGNALVLALDKIVELTEFSVDEKNRFSEIKEMFGTPYRTFNNPSNTKTLVYGNFALDLQDDTIIKVIHFGKP